MFWPDQPDQPDQPVTAVDTAMIAAQPVSFFMTVFRRASWTDRLVSKTVVTLSRKDSLHPQPRAALPSGSPAALVPACCPAQTQSLFKLLFVKLAANGQQLILQPGNPSLLDGSLPDACRSQLDGHQEDGPRSRGVPNRGRERGPAGDRRVGQRAASSGRRCHWWFTDRVLGIGHAHGGTPLDLDLRRPISEEHTSELQS